MSALRPLFADERTAAQLLDMAPATFRRLVADGVLPPPCRVGEIERWDVEELQAIMRGRKPRRREELEL